MGNRNTKNIKESKEVAGYIDNLCDKNKHNNKFHIFIYNMGDGYYQIEDNGTYH